MPKTKAQKVEAVAAIADRLHQSAGAVFADFTGVKINEIEELRKKSRAEGCEYLVVKKTLFKRAAKDESISFDASTITGALSILFGFSDPVAPAKVAKNFVKGHAAMRILGGLIREADIVRALDQTGVSALGDLPSRDELRARMVGSIAAPLRGLVGVLQGNLRKFVYVLNAINKAKAS